MGGQAAEQIIAGVVLSERLAVTPYGAIHRAQWSGQRDNRGLVVEPKLLDETSFRDALTDPAAIASAIKLSHPTIVPIVAVESGGADVVVVTRGVGRYVTLQDLIVAARASRANGGKLALPVAASIGKQVVQALAAAHAAKLVHGAVHPRSVLVDEDGAIRLGDFLVGRALATAVAQGADNALWRGLAGTIAPELVVGEDPTPGCDVFAAGALLFTMLSGETPPGPLRSTPAVERLVQRALDTDPSRRYKSAADLLENLLEAFEDDGWQLAERTEIITVAGLSGTDSAIDDATEDLLASLGSATNAVQVTPIRPSMDIRAEAISARHNKGPNTQNRLDALLADLDDSTNGSSSSAASAPRAPSPAPPRARPRVPSLDNPDEPEESDPGYTPLPPPTRESDADILSGAEAALRSVSESERQALDSLADLDEPAEPAAAAPRSRPGHPRARSQPMAAVPGPAATPSPPPSRDSKPTRRSAPVPAARPDSEVEPPALEPAPPPPVKRRSEPRPVASPVVDAPVIADVPTPRLKSRFRSVIFLALIAAAGGAFYMVYRNQQADRAANDAKRLAKQKEIEEQERRMAELQAVSGAIKITSTPSDASVWLKLGRTPVDSITLPSSQMHEIRIENLDGFEPVDTQVLPANWSGGKANVVVPLTASPKDAKGNVKSTKLPAMPPKPATVTGYPEGTGPLHIESTPRGAEVWLLVGVTNNAELSGIEAAAGYELRVLKDGFRPAYITISPEDWRDGGNPKEPLAVAKKKAVVEKSVELAPEKGR